MSGVEQQEQGRATRSKVRFAQRGPPPYGRSTCTSGRPADRPHGHPLAGDIGDARRDDHLDMLVLEGPLSAPQLDRAQERAIGHDDRVGAHPGRRLGGSGRLPDVRHTNGRGFEVALVVGAQGPATR